VHSSEHGCTESMSVGCAIRRRRNRLEVTVGMRIHPTAIVDAKAELGDNVVVGPYAVIGPNVVIGDGTSIGPYVVVDGYTHLGKNNVLFAGAVLGTRSQALKDSGDKSYLRVGDGNTFREYVTVNSGFAEETGRTTVVGNNTLLMALTHVAHDCHVGDRVVMANLSGLGGHVIVEDGAVLGGMAAIHQYVTIGTMVLIGGLAKVVKDVPPYTIVDGNPARCRGLNAVGLARNNVSEVSRRALKTVYRILFQSSLNTTQALAQIEQEVEICPEVTHLVDFVRGSKRGICK